MRNLSIRKLDEKLYHQLQARAAAKHVSMEEEARQILQQAVLAPNNIPEIFEKYKYEIPVININGVIAFKYKITEDEFRIKLKRRIGT